MSTINNTYGGIITGGLGLSACQGMIVNKFHLLPQDAVIVVVKEQGGGGPYPGPAWNKVDNIQNFYTPVEDNQQPYIIPMDKEADYLRRFTTITITVNLKKLHVEKIYQVPEERGRTIVNILNMMNTTKERINIHAGKIKRIATRAIVKIRNLRKRKRT